MKVAEKIEALKAISTNDEELGNVLDKLFDTALNKHRLKREQYKRELFQFEQRFSMDSKTFSEKFEKGKLGDNMDFFEWSALYELFLDVEKRIKQIEALDGKN